MSDSLYDTHDGLALADLVRKGTVSSLELLEDAIQRVEKADSKVGLIANRTYDYARDQIKQGLPDGPFKGVPFMLKDEEASCIAGLPITTGTKLLQDNVAQTTSTLAQRFLNTGVLMMGYTKVPPWFVTFDCERSWYGRCMTPWNPENGISGGSSAGSAAVVGAGALPMASGSDGGGSLRLPSAWCGAFTIKPSRGRIPAGPPLTEEWFGMATFGHITRSVRDHAALMDATMGIALGSSYTAPQPKRSYLEEVQHECPPLRVAVQTQDHDGREFHPHHLAAVEETARLLEELGHNVEYAAPKIDIEELSNRLYDNVALSTQIAIKALGEQRGRPIDDDELEALIVSFRNRGRVATGPDILRVNELSMLVAYDFAVFMQSYDVVVSATVSRPATEPGWVYRNETNLDEFRRDQNEILNMTQVQNFTGQPAASVPLCWSPDKQPVGIMLVGRYGDESTLYSLSAQLERAKPWWGRMPEGIL